MEPWQLEPAALVRCLGPHPATRLAPGLGPAGVLRFLRALREIWPEAAELPLAPPARAAAACPGWSEPHAPEWQLPAASDVSRAERLGSAACQRGSVARCPLARACAGRVC